jgi:two-component system nitrogen regulation response regulator NtrX
MTAPAKILVIDDEQGIHDAFQLIFELEGYELISATSGEEGLVQVSKKDPDLIFLDVKLPRMSGIDVLRSLKESGNSVPVIMISGHGTIETAVEATRYGAFNFLEKPLDRERLLLLAKNALETQLLKRENRDLKLKFHRDYRMVGQSTALMKLQNLVAKAAPTNATVLITGESGTGKELIARAIHRNSKRAEKRFIQVNCAAIPEELIESELFGHEKGSFTGASERKIGKFQQADGGTIFLDEVADMSSKTQAKVLRVLQEGEVERIGSDITIKVDVRIIAATNKDLPKMIEENDFREDLFFRLNVIPIVSPALRERPEDIPLLVDHFTAIFCEENNFKTKQFTPEAMEYLTRHPWKGNIRELRNVVERALILSDENIVTVGDLAGSDSREVADIKALLSGSQTLRDFKDKAERQFIVHKLRENDWNILQTAKAIDTPRSNLYKKIEQFEISKERDS